MLETNIKKVATQVPTPVTPTTPQSPISGGTYTVGGNKATSAPGKSLAAPRTQIIPAVTIPAKASLLQTPLRNRHLTMRYSRSAAESWV